MTTRRAILCGPAGGAPGVIGGGVPETAFVTLGAEREPRSCDEDRGGVGRDHRLLASQRERRDVVLLGDERGFDRADPGAHVLAVRIELAVALEEVDLLLHLRGQL